MMPVETAKPKAAISWSGGKDSYLAFHRLRKQVDFVALLTMFDETGTRSRSHGLRPEILLEHARLLGLRPFFGTCSWASYTEEFVRLLEEMRTHGVCDVVFGDIFGESHREWTERVCARARVRAHEPLWSESTQALVDEFLGTGAKAQIVTVNRKWLGASFLGRTLNRGLLRELAQRGVDPAGERGEYHTLVTDATEFTEALQLETGEAVLKGDCWAIDLALQKNACFAQPGL